VAAGVAGTAAGATVLTGLVQAVTGANLVGVGAGLVLLVMLAVVAAVLYLVRGIVLNARHLRAQRPAARRPGAHTSALPDYPAMAEWYRANGMPLSAEVAARLAGTPPPGGRVHSVLCQYPAHACTCGALSQEGQQ
jgi:hypothetical protein